MPQIIIQIPTSMLMSTSASGSAQPHAVSAVCVHCGRTWSDTASTIQDEATSEYSFKEEEEEEDDDDLYGTAAPILHNDPNFNTTRISTDFSDTSTKHEPMTPSINSPEYESIDFSSSLYESGRFGSIEEIVSYLREVMDYDI
jgi:hypothetical protein